MSVFVTGIFAKAWPYYESEYNLYPYGVSLFTVEGAVVWQTDNCTTQTHVAAYVTQCLLIGHFVKQSMDYLRCNLRTVKLTRLTLVHYWNNSRQRLCAEDKPQNSWKNLRGHLCGVKITIKDGIQQVNNLMVNIVTVLWSLTRHGLYICEYIYAILFDFWPKENAFI